MRKIRKSKPPEQAIEQYTFYGDTVVYTCPYCSAQLGGGARRAGGRRGARSAGRGSFMRRIDNDYGHKPNA